MFSNFFISAWRNRLFSFINVLGLSIGISAALVIFLIVHFEFKLGFQTIRTAIANPVKNLRTE